MCTLARHIGNNSNLLVVVNEAAARNLNHLMLDTAGPSTALRQGLQAGGVLNFNSERSYVEEGSMGVEILAETLYNATEAE
eukprot:scaffold93797_cov17-Tisochrysis_lutea.AAC.1